MGAGEDQEDGTPLLAPDSPADFVLATLVRLANTTGLTIGVTLVVGGQAYSGSLCGGKMWSTAVASRLRSIGDLGEVLARQFDGLSEHYADENNETLPIGYVHLLNAAAVPAGGPRTHPQGLEMRFNIDSIEGWALGVVGDLAPPPNADTPET